MRRLHVLVVVFFSGLLLLPLKASAFYAQAGVGLYGGVGYCPYQPRTARNAILNRDEYRDRQNDIDEMKDELKDLKKEVRKQRRARDKAKRDITGVLTSAAWDAVEEHWTHKRSMGEYHQQCDCPGAAPATPVTPDAGTVNRDRDGRGTPTDNSGVTDPETAPRGIEVDRTEVTPTERRAIHDRTYDQWKMDNCNWLQRVDGALGAGCWQMWMNIGPDQRDREAERYGIEGAMYLPGNLNKGFWNNVASFFGFGEEEKAPVKSTPVASSGLNRVPAGGDGCTAAQIAAADPACVGVSDEVAPAPASPAVPAEPYVPGVTPPTTRSCLQSVPIPEAFCPNHGNRWHNPYGEDGGKVSEVICMGTERNVVRSGFTDNANDRYRDRLDCESGFEDWYEAMEYLEENERLLAELERNLERAEAEFDRDVDDDVEDLEADCPDGSCYDIHHSNKPTTLETVGNIGLTLLGALGAYRLGQNAIDMNARAGWPTPPAGVASFGYPFMMAGLYGLTSGLTGRGGFGCAGGQFGGGYGMGPYGMAGAYGPFAGMYGGMGGPFGYPPGMFGPMMGGGMYMPGMGPWGMAGPWGPGGMMMGGMPMGGMMIGGAIGAMMGGYPYGGMMMGGAIGAMMGGMPMGGMMMSGMMMGGYPMGGMMMGGMPMGGMMMGGAIGAMMGGMPMGGMMMGGMPMGGAMMGGYPMGGMMMGGMPMGGMMMGGAIGAMMGGYPMSGMMMGGMPMGGGGMMMGSYPMAGMMMGGPIGGGQLQMQMQHMYMQQMQQAMAIQAQQQQEAMYRQQTIGQLTNELYRIQMQIQQISMGGYGSTVMPSIYTPTQPTFVPGGGTVTPGGTNTGTGGNSAPRR